MKSRKELKQQTRERLLKVAFEEFSKGGLLATKTLDIAESAKVSHGTLFSHFPTRDALLLAVIEEFGMQLGIQLENQMREGSVESVLTTHIAVLQEWEPFYYQLVICAPHLSENIRTAIFNIQSGIAYHIERVLSQQLTEIKVPLYLILNTWLGLVHHYLVNRDLFAPNRSVLATKGPELIQFFMNLIKGVSL